MEPDRQPSDTATAFARDGYVVLRGWLPAPLRARIAEACDGARRANAWLDGAAEATTACKGGASRYVYGAPPLDGLLEFLARPIGRVIGVELLPSYSYLRVYGASTWLAAHRDRPACEISLTMPVPMQASQTPWPIWFKDRHGQDVAIELCPGDLALYRGCELLHWRDQRESAQADRAEQAHLFMHWVDAAGPNAAWKFDRRPALGLPGETRRLP